VMTAVTTNDARALAGDVMMRLADVSGLEAKLRALVAVLFEFAERRRHRHRVFYSQADPTDPEMAEMLRSIRGAVAAVLAHELARETDGLSDQDSGMLAHGVIAMAEGCAVGWAASPSVPAERAVELVSRLALNTLRTQLVTSTP